MEVFSLLKFWRNAAADSTVAGYFDCNNVDGLETDDDEYDDEDSFFDLVLTDPDCDCKVEEENNSITSVDVKSIENDKGKQVHHHSNKLSKIVGETKSNNLIKSAPLPTSPSDVFSILPLQTNSKPQSPISLLRSPPKFRIFMLGFNKSSNFEKAESNSLTSSMATPKREQQSKRFSMRYNVEDVPVVTIFSRDNSVRSKLQRKSSDDSYPSVNEVSKRSTKDAGVQKYLRMIKPLYVMVTKKHADKVRNPDQSAGVMSSPLPSTAAVCSPRKQASEDTKQGGRGAAFREVCRNLVKSRSASSTVGTLAPVRATGRRDDSIVQQQDGIQSAILHCKRSYSSSSSSSMSQDCSMVLSRSASDSSHRNSQYPAMISEEEKRSSI